MDRNEIIERLEEIAKHAVHTAGEKRFVMSLDDGIALHEAIDILKKPEVLAHGEGELSAQPERKTGKWILIADGYTDYVKCDQCGNISYVERNFCPSCGADMRGEQDE